jgi:hypothetical protein
VAVTPGIASVVVAVAVAVVVGAGTAPGGCEVVVADGVFGTVPTETMPGGGVVVVGAEAGTMPTLSGVVPGGGGVDGVVQATSALAASGAIATPAAARAKIVAPSAGRTIDWRTRRCARFMPRAYEQRASVDMGSLRELSRSDLEHESGKSAGVGSCLQRCAWCV